MIPTFYAGFCPFRRHHRVVAWLGYGAGAGVYLLGYGLVASVLASVLPWSGSLPVGAAAVVAALLAGGALGWLYGRAVGSPYGNVLLALVSPTLVPWVVYASPFPGTSTSGGTLSHPEVVAPAALAGLAAMLWTVDRAYAGMDDPIAWEQAMMPHGFRVADGEHLDATGERVDGEEDRRGGEGGAAREGGDGDENEADDEEVTPRLRPRMAHGTGLPTEGGGRIGTLAALDREASLRLSVRGWLASAIVVPPVMALALYGQTTYGDDAFSGVMLFAVLMMIHWSLRVESEDEAQAADA